MRFNKESQNDYINNRSYQGTNDVIVRMKRLRIVGII